MFLKYDWQWKKEVKKNLKKKSSIPTNDSLINFSQNPCSCTSTRYEEVKIVCDGAPSLGFVLDFLTTSSFIIDSLTIGNTRIDTVIEKIILTKQNFQFPGYAFQGYRIKKMFLRNNGLKTFHPNAFTGELENTLEELEIKGNYINTIPQAGLPSLKHLKILSLPGIKTLLISIV